jgi:hypothetical protein
LSVIPDARRYRRNLIVASPLVLAVPVVLGVIVVVAGVPFEVGAFVAGVIGWLVALALRAPVALAGMRLTGGDRNRVQAWITAASGPAEELVRLGVLLIVGRTLPQALWIGIGWAAIEAIYSVINGVALLALMGRTDPEAEQARAMLPMPEVLGADAPLWGVVERAWASLLHVGFTLILAAQPVLVILTIVAHSATNILFLRWGPRLGMARIQLAGAIWSMVVLAVATVLWRS